MRVKLWLESEEWLEWVLSVAAETIVDHYPLGDSGDNDTDTGDKVVRDNSRLWETSSLSYNNSLFSPQAALS